MTSAILLVASGPLSSTHHRLESEVREAFPGHEIGWAGKARPLSEAYAELRKRGVQSVVLLSLHLFPGEQHQSAVGENPQGLQVAYAGPLLGTDADTDEVVRCLGEDLPQDRPVLVVVHGHTQGAHFNPMLNGLAERLAAKHKDLFLTRLKGDEAPWPLETFIQRAQTQGRVHVVPFLFASGEHLRKDILGDGETSLKSRLGVPDFSCGAVLGERPWVRRQFIEQLRRALDGISY